MTAIPHWTPTDLAQKAQDIAQPAISKRLVEVFTEHWGVNWIDLLNHELRRVAEEKRLRTPEWRARTDLILIKGEPNWDWNVMLLTLSDCVKTVPRLKINAPRLKNLAYELRTGRNQYGHKTGVFDHNNKDFAEGHIKNTIQMMKLLDGRDRVDQIEDLLRYLQQGLTQSDNAAKIDTTGWTDAVDREEIKQIRGMLEELLKRARDEKSSLSPLQEAPKQEQAATEAPSAKPAAASTLKGSVLGRRRNPIPPSQDGVVLFPVVSAFAEYANDIGCVRCARYVPQSRPDSYSLVIGLIGPARSNLYYQVIQDARTGEDDPERAFLYTHSRIDPNDFDGSSFGLAVAIADRSARYGFSAKLVGRQVIATGTIEAGGQGAVMAVDGFEAKVRLLEREAAADSMFVFPAANLERADEDTRQRLERARRSGRFSWKAITHVAELDDFFGREDEEQKPTPAQPTSASEPVATLAARDATAAMPSGRPNLFALKAPKGWVKLSIAGGLAGAAALAAVSLFAEFSERNRLDPLVVQASDERLMRLARLGTSIGGSPSDARNCRELLAATSDLTTVDRNRMLAVHRDALSAADRCSAALRESDRRWEDLVRAANAAGSSGGSTLDGLAQARVGLTPFDLSRRSEANYREPLTLADEAVATVGESDRRWSSLSTAVARWRSDQSTTALDAVVTGWRALNAQDLQRATGDRAQVAATVRGVVADWTSSEARLGDVMSAASDLRRDNTAANRDNAERTLSQINRFDRSRANAEQRRAIEDAQRLQALGRLADLDKAASAYATTRSPEMAAALGRAVAALKPGDDQFMTASQRAARQTAQSIEIDFMQSDARLRELVQSHKLLEAAETAGRNIVIAANQLLDQARRITALDQNRMNAEQRAAVARADYVRRDMAASDARINEAVRGAEISLANRANSGAAEAVQRSRNALTAIDRERLSPDQRSLLDRVCGVGPVTPGILAPLDICPPISGVDHLMLDTVLPPLFRPTDRNPRQDEFGLTRTK